MDGPGSRVPRLNQGGAHGVAKDVRAGMPCLLRERFSGERSCCEVCQILLGGDEDGALSRCFRGSRSGFLPLGLLRPEAFMAEIAVGTA